MAQASPVCFVSLFVFVCGTKLGGWGASLLRSRSQGLISLVRLDLMFVFVLFRFAARDPDDDDDDFATLVDDEYLTLAKEIDAQPFGHGAAPCCRLSSLESHSNPNPDNARYQTRSEPSCLVQIWRRR